MKFYCVKCKKKVEADLKETKTTKNGIKMARSICPKCGTKLTKFLGK